MKGRKFLPSLLNSPGRIEEEFGANNTFKPTVFLEPLFSQHCILTLEDLELCCAAS